MTPYYSHGGITIYHGDCREVPAVWIGAAALVTDPPYGRDWRQGRLERSNSRAHSGIVGDRDSSVRDAAIALWPADRRAVVFGDLMLQPPTGTKQVLVYQKPPDAGMRGATGGFRRDAEAIYLIGPWSSGIGGVSSVLRSHAPMVGGQHGPAGQTGHPHTKPVDLMSLLITATEAASVADPFMGSGSTLVAAKALGVTACGVEEAEEWCEIAARRLEQEVLDFGPVA